MKCAGLLVLPLLLAACGGPDSYAEREDFHADPSHRRDFSVAAAPLCAAARQVLLGDGYVVATADGKDIAGSKEFRIEDKEHALLRIYASCTDRPAGSTLFVTATEERFDVKTTRQSTSVGVPLVAPITFSSKTESDSQVKTQGQTVEERGFYERFYRAVQRELSRQIE